MEQETGAREGAEIKLAEAASTIEELRQLERELHSAVRDLNADLRLASERAIDSYVLKREVADLKKQLEDSRNECELLRRRARFGNADGHSVSKAAGVASADGTGVDSSSIVERFEQSIRDVSAYQALRKHDPAFYDRLITTYKVLLGQGLTDTQINDVLRAELAEFMEELLPGASDDAIIAYARLIIDQLDELQLDGVERCLSLLVPQSGPSRDASPVYSEKTRERELDVLDRTLKTYDADRVFPTKKDVWPDLEPVFMELIDAFGADNVAALQNSYDPNIDRILVCNVSRTLYSGILNLPNRNAAEALRWLLTP